MNSSVSGASSFSVSDGPVANQTGRSNSNAFIFLLVGSVTGRSGRRHVDRWQPLRHGRVSSAADSKSQNARAPQPKQPPLLVQAAGRGPPAEPAGPGDLMLRVSLGNVIDARKFDGHVQKHW